MVIPGERVEKGETSDCMNLGFIKGVFREFMCVS